MSLHTILFSSIICASIIELQHPYDWASYADSTLAVMERIKIV